MREMVGSFVLGAGGALLRKTVGSQGEPEAQSLGFSEEERKRGLRECTRVCLFSKYTG